MFEKEAKKWVRENTYTEHSASFGEIKVEPSAEKGFQKGAEFGYNKANEWHYVSEKGTPKTEGHYLVCLRNKDKDIFDCWIYYDKDVGWYSMEVRMKDIYAWKEIIPPKESE